jgi:hypothetical protein
MLDVKDKQYQKFTPQERVNLAISAMARNDSKEVERLWDTCPIYSYRTRDLEYKARFLAITLISTVYFEKCVYHYNAIMKVDSYASLADEIDPKYFNEEEPIFDKLNLARKIHLSRLKALRQGLIQFCCHIGINSEDLLKTIHVENACFDIDLLLALEVETNQELIQRAKEMFLEYWHF